jgi:hypothetical protein
MNTEAFISIVAEVLREGGPGSGNWGHAGIRGYHGGSLPTKGNAGAVMSLISGPTARARQIASQGKGSISYEDAVRQANTELIAQLEKERILVEPDVPLAQEKPQVPEMRDGRPIAQPFMTLPPEADARVQTTARMDAAKADWKKHHKQPFGLAKRDEIFRAMMGSREGQEGFMQGRIDRAWGKEFDLTRTEPAYRMRYYQGYMNYTKDYRGGLRPQGCIHPAGRGGANSAACVAGRPRYAEAKRPVAKTRH